MRLTRLFVLTAILVGASIELIAQPLDTVIKNDGTTVQGKVIKVTGKEIEIDPKGAIPFVIVQRSDVESILYADGTLVKFQEAKAQPKTQQNEEASTTTQLQFIDKNEYKITDLLLFDGRGNCNSASWQNMSASFNSEEFYSIEGTARKGYKINVIANWDASAQAGPIIGKGRSKIVIQNVTLTIRLLKGEESVFTRNFDTPPFAFEICRSSMRGNEQVISKVTVPDHTVELDRFYFGGVTFTPLIKFNDGLFVWPSNSPISAMYQSYRVSLRVLLNY